jgi:hypothetical protein
MNYLKTLWAFSRPHTIIGSFLSIVSLFLITAAVAFPGISPKPSPVTFLCYGQHLFRPLPAMCISPALINYRILKLIK